MVQLIVEIVISIGIVALLVMALMQRKQETKVYIKEENDEDRGKYWDTTEQDWSSKRNKETLSERRETYLNSSIDLLKKQITAFVYDENPDLANLDSKGFANLNNVLAKHAQAIVQDVEKIKKEFVLK
jgi:FtsZ-interacting cell division protein ZipA